MNCNWGHAYGKGFVVLAEDLETFRLGDIATGGKMNPSDNLSSTRTSLQYWKVKYPFRFLKSNNTSSLVLVD
jgi:hypothetical protein